MLCISAIAFSDAAERQPSFFFPQFLQHIFQYPLLIAAKAFLVHPYDLFFPAEPGELSLGKMPGLPLDQTHGLLKGKLPVKIPEKLFVAEPLHGDHAFVISHCPQLFDLVKQALLEHLIHPLIDPLVELLSVVI